MNYIWEVLLFAKENAIQEQDIEFIRAVTPNPYLEVALDDLNINDIAEYHVDVNPFYRFGTIFQAFFDGRLENVEDTAKCLVDILFHFLGQIDLYDGMTRQEYSALFLSRDILNGHFGLHNKDILSTFSFDHKNHLLMHMVYLYRNGTSVYLLYSLLRYLYPSSMVYLDTTDSKDMLIYIGRERTSLLARQVQFIMDMFIPLDCNIHLFWELHFGIVGVEETMQIEGIMIY